MQCSKIMITTSETVCDKRVPVRKLPEIILHTLAQ